MKKLFSVVALLALMGLVIAGCKPTDDGTKPPAAPATNAPAVPAAPSK